MRKRTLVTFAVITLLVLGALAFGVGRTQGASAHVQAPAVHTQSNTVQTQVNGTENDPPDPGETPGSAEDQGQDQNLPGGGHQDPGSTTDHQFEGSE
jgi:hypothetical protein